MLAQRGAAYADGNLEANSLRCDYGTLPACAVNNFWVFDGCYSVAASGAGRGAVRLTCWQLHCSSCQRTLHLPADAPHRPADREGGHAEYAESALGPDTV